MTIGSIFIYVLFGILATLWFLFTGTGGFNFSLKINFMANFFAPLVAFILVNTLGISIEPLRLVCILGIALSIIYFIAVLTMYNSAGGQRPNKTKCKNYNITSALKNALTILFGALITFAVVSNFEALRRPFINILSKNSTNYSPEMIVYGIIGLYMALVSLSTTSLSYFPALTEGCQMTTEEIIAEWEQAKDISPATTPPQGVATLRNPIYKTKEDVMNKPAAAATTAAATTAAATTAAATTAPMSAACTTAITYIKDGIKASATTLIVKNLKTIIESKTPNCSVCMSGIDGNNNTFTFNIRSGGINTNKDLIIYNPTGLADTLKLTYKDLTQYLISGLIKIIDCPT